MLSEKDKALIRKMNVLDEESYTNWPAIMHLANQLEDKDEYERWNSKCKMYNHLEEASIGEL